MWLQFVRGASIGGCTIGCRKTLLRTDQSLRGRARGIRKIVSRDLPDAPPTCARDSTASYSARSSPCRKDSCPSLQTVPFGRDGDEPLCSCLCPCCRRVMRNASSCGCSSAPRYTAPTGPKPSVRGSARTSPAPWRRAPSDPEQTDTQTVCRSRLEMATMAPVSTRDRIPAPPRSSSSLQPAPHQRVGRRHDPGIVDEVGPVQAAPCAPAGRATRQSSARMG